jgi:hypothetical protein
MPKKDAKKVVATPKAKVEVIHAWPTNHPHAPVLEKLSDAFNASVDCCEDFTVREMIARLMNKLAKPTAEDRRRQRIEAKIKKLQEELAAS